MPRKKKDAYNRYMKDYMKDYRKMEREAIREARRLLGLSTKVRTRKTQKKPKQQSRHKK